MSSLFGRRQNKRKNVAPLIFLPAVFQQRFLKHYLSVTILRRPLLDFLFEIVVSKSYANAYYESLLIQWIKLHIRASFESNNSQNNVVT